MRSQPFGFRVRHLLIAVACVAAGLFVCDRTVQVIGVGSYDLEVRLVPPKAREIVRVSGDFLGSFENLESLRADPERYGVTWKDVGWVRGQPFLVRVRFSRHDSGIGRELTHGQYSRMILRVEFDRGSPEYLIVDIPDGRVKRTVDVSVPDR